MLQQTGIALNRDGVLRIATPDVAAAVAAYCSDTLELTELLSYYRGLGKRAEQKADLLNIVFHEWGHGAGYQYDRSALQSLLVECGYTTITGFTPGESEDPVLRGLEKRSSSVEDRLQLVVEARK